ncbi:MAG TPA: glycosyltransferase family 2 protein [Solirubrobacteraceae bacterium]
MGGPRISVVIVAYREREKLADALRSCVAAGAAVVGGIELIVVDNGGLASLVREHVPRAIVVEPGENLGFAGAVARGIAASSGEWVALVNDDALLEPDTLRHLLEAGERDERVGSVAAQVRFHADPARVNSAGIAVDSLGVASERMAGAAIALAGERCDVFGACGCVALYRRSMLDETGGFDPRFFAYQEDVDLAWRARAAGWLAVYEPLAVALHHGSASSGEGSRRKYFLVGRNRVRLLARNATAAQLVRACPGILAYDLAYVVYVALTDRTLAPLHGRLRGLREWRTFRADPRLARRPVKLDSALGGWLGALRQHRAYRELGANARR